MWVINYLGVIESDLSAVHRIDDMSKLSTRRFIGLVTRLPYYKASALRQIIEMEQENGSDSGGNSARNYETPSQPPSQTEVKSSASSESKIHQLGPLVEKKKPDRVYNDISKNLEAFELGFIEAGVG